MKKKSVFIAFMTAMLIVSQSGCGVYEDASATLAKGMINQEISRNKERAKRSFGPSVTKCEKVKIKRKIAFGQWRARAYFDNGAEMDCIIDNKIIFQQVQPDNGTIRRGR